MAVQGLGDVTSVFQPVHRVARAALAVLGAAFLASLALPANASDFSEPWKRRDRALVIDAYEYNSIDWQKLALDKRIVGFINKASDGLPPDYYCSGGETEIRLCKALWKRHAVARELFQTRKIVAKAIGLKWGAYHLGRPGNPVDQANNFIDFAEPGPDDLIALDIEENDAEKWMSLEDAEIFVGHIQKRLGRYPVLYTNGVTAAHIAQNRERYRILSRLPLWYARYKPEIGLHFPKGHWQSYALWQFSAGANCDARSCPYRVPGTSNDIDVNVASMSAAELRAEWPFGGLIEQTVDTIATVPLPTARRTAIEGGDVTVQFARVEEGTASAEAEPAQPPALEPVEIAGLTVESDEIVPLPISRRAALGGGDVTLQFAAVEEKIVTAVRAAGFPSMFPAAGRGLPMRVALGEPAETLSQVEFTNYVQVIEKTRQFGAPIGAGDISAVSAAALDDPGPIVPASQFARAGLPIFLLRKLDGSDETLP